MAICTVTTVTYHFFVSDVLKHIQDVFTRMRVLAIAMASVCLSVLSVNAVYHTQELDTQYVDRLIASVVQPGNSQLLLTICC